MQTALAKLKNLVAGGHYRKALKLAASWPRLGKHTETIKKGWAAASNPAFYREIGEDPVVLEKAGMFAMRERYKLETTGPGCDHCQSMNEPPRVCPFCGKTYV